jgi:hypothetical protein
VSVSGFFSVPFWGISTRRGLAFVGLYFARDGLFCRPPYNLYTLAFLKALKRLLSGQRLRVSVDLSHL